MLHGCGDGQLYIALTWNFNGISTRKFQELADNIKTLLLPEYNGLERGLRICQTARHLLPTMRNTL